MPSPYEEQAWKAIAEWKKPSRSWLAKVARTVSWPFEKVSDGVMNAPGIGAILEKTIGGLVGLANDVAQWSVRPDAIYAEYRAAGFPGVATAADIYALDLQNVDERLRWLSAKYKSMSLAEGVASGAAGLPGIPVDIVALVLINLRAIGEYATYCGFDVSTEHERLYAMQILTLASSPSDTSKAVTMAQLVKIAREAAQKKSWEELKKHSFVKVIQRIAKALGVRLTKAKLAQFVPVAGAAIGGGFNSYFTAKVCEAAYFLYRERFLATKYGDDFIAR